MYEEDPEIDDLTVLFAVFMFVYLIVLVAIIVK